MLKVRSRYRFNRLWLAMAVVLAGLLAGYLVGRQSILHLAHLRLEQSADLILEREDEIGDEILSVVSQANASPDAPCSDGDIALLRRLTFVARFLKDVGRIENDSLLCSATVGKLAEPFVLMKPDMVFPGKLHFYQNYPLHHSNDRAPIVALGRADVVISPDVLADFSQQPISYSVQVVDPSKVQASPVASAPEKRTLGTAMYGTAGSGTAGPQAHVWGTGARAYAVRESKPKSNRVRRIGDSMVLDRCSRRYPICVTTNLPMETVWRSARSLSYGYVATGGAAGTTCAMVLLLAGRKRRSPTNQLKRAILMGKLSVAYQPVVHLGSNRIVGAEALARWTDEDGDSIRPETIIALAEAEGFVSEITRFVLTRALQELRPVFEVDPDFQISVNLAPSDLADPRLLLLLDESLSGDTITPANVAFELPERATFNREIAVAAIRRLRDRGHAVFIDDFGTGYSNLAYLNELNVDGIKINRTFIATIGTDSVTASIVPQILAVAEALNLKVVLQGIERAEQAAYFRADNPQMLAQGWFFGLPVPARSLLFLCAEKSE